jgi:tRNA (mo5U34)-methyltransferase
VTESPLIARLAGEIACPTLTLKTLETCVGRRFRLPGIKIGIASSNQDEVVMQGPDIAELSRQAQRFEGRLNRIKAALTSRGIAWYPYRTLTVFSILEKLLTGPRRRLIDIAAGDPILDLGCGDGDLSFFFESLGCEVLAVDNPHTTQNQMRGFMELHAALKSSVRFEAMDLDSQFCLPDDVFGLAIFVGVLYHLKNPYYALEALATRARYCLLSTRIAQQTPKGNPMQGESLAYLLAADEANDDATNYWIFSETALRGLLDRTGWTVCDFETSGASRGSEPARLDRDQRAFCLLESRRCPRYSVKLLEGWYPLEQSCFRWTERCFSIQINRPHLIKFSTLLFNFRLPTPGPVTLSAAVNGMSMPPATFATEGDQSYNIKLPRDAVKASTIRVDFAVDKCLPAGAFDERELALLVPFWKPGLNQADTVLPFHLS